MIWRKSMDKARLPSHAEDEDRDVVTAPSPLPSRATRWTSAAISAAPRRRTR